MIDRLKKIKARYDELSDTIAQPSAMEDMQAWRAMVKEHAQIEPVAHKYIEYQGVLDELADCRQMLEEETDAELRDMSSQEVKTLHAKREEMEEEIRILLLPKDPNDERNVVMEIRAGTGGE